MRTWAGSMRAFACLFWLFSDPLLAQSPNLFREFVVELPECDLQNRPLELELHQQGALAVVVISTDCPISNSYQPGLRRLAQDFRDQPLDWLFVHANPKTLPSEAQRHAADFQIELPIVLDPDSKLLAKLGATTVPSVFVFEIRQERLVYSGRIDNLYESLGRKRAVATEFELRTTLEAIFQNQPIETTYEPPVGCRIHYDR